MGVLTARYSGEEREGEGSGEMTKVLCMDSLLRLCRWKVKYVLLKT